MPNTSACALGLIMRRLTAHELDLRDAVVGWFGGDVAEWLRGFEPTLRELERRVARLPKGWRGNGDNQKWMNALQDHIPEELLQRFRVAVTTSGTKGLGQRNIVDARLHAGVPAKLYAAAWTQRRVKWYGEYEAYTYSDTRIEELDRVYADTRRSDRKQGNRV